MIEGKAINSDDKVFNTPARCRCRDCAYLIEDDNIIWVCDDCGKDIEKIADDECSMNQEF